MRLQRRARFLFSGADTFNHSQLAAPGTKVGSPLFGLVTAMANQPRAIQFGSRLEF